MSDSQGGRQRPSRGSGSSNIKQEARLLRDDSSRSTPPQPSLDATNSVEIASDQNARTSFTTFSPSSNPPAQTFKIPQSPRNAAMSTGESSSKAPKMAIPRLKRSHEGEEGTSKPTGRHRVNHACEPCRHRKTKCSGERPHCRHCQDFKIMCYYADGKRDRVKKQFGSMTEKVADYEKVFRDLMTRASIDDAAIIRNTLSRAAQLDADHDQSGLTTVASMDDEEAVAEASGAESEASGGAGSTGALDRTEEDFTRKDAKTTGFMGKNSEITWLQRLRELNKFDDSSPLEVTQLRNRELRATSERSAQSAQTGSGPTFLAEADEDFNVQSNSYHLNDLPLAPYDNVDPYELPTIEQAQQLFATYFQRVHASFPIIGQINLRNQFQRFILRPTSRAPSKWLAIINLIFAISAKYSHLVQAEWAGDERDHVIYFTRAKLLAVDGDFLFTHPDLQNIQVLGLMAFYLMCAEQINRAWTLAGLAIREATALGLNMRNDSGDLSGGLKEIRYKVWWALYCLEHRLCCMTGRVNCILDEHCTTPLPVPLPEDEYDSELGHRLLSSGVQGGDRAPASNTQSPQPQRSERSSSSNERARSEAKSSTRKSPQPSTISDLEWAKDVGPNAAHYFLHLVQLCRFTQSVFQKLYCPAVITGTWSDVQKQIRSLETKLETWYRNLPVVYDFRRRQRDRDHYQARLALGFFYYSTKIMIHRPCLCQLDKKMPNQSEKSDAINRESAKACIMAAKDQLSLIPDEPNAAGLLRVGPWPTILHQLVQASTVLMLEISFRTHHMPEQRDEIIEASKKAIRWLHALGDENLAAARAWKLCNGLLRDAALKLGQSLVDIPDQDPRAFSGPELSQQTVAGGSGDQQMVYDQERQMYTQSRMQDYSQQYPPQLSRDNYAQFNQLDAFGAGNVLGFGPYHGQSYQSPGLQQYQSHDQGQITQDQQQQIYENAIRLYQQQQQQGHQQHQGG